MSSQSNLTVEEARNIVLDIGKSHGWLPPEQREETAGNRVYLEANRRLKVTLGNLMET